MGKQRKKISKVFDPEGSGYDYETALMFGITPDETGHWQSRVPETGQILKGRKHETYKKTIKGEKEAGYKIYKGEDGKYYSKENIINMKAKKKTKRSIKSYAMGTNKTGVIKGYMPNPDEVFAQNNIDIAKAQYEAASNPFVMGGKALGGVMMEQGMNMFQRGGGFGAFKKVAMGTGQEGVGQVPIEAEQGEIIETPDGQVAEVGGQKHTQGGTDLDVPQGTKVFSDQLKVAGKTMAERKEARERELKKLQKAVDRDSSDALAKNTFKIASEKFAVEEQQDLELQSFAGQLDEIYNYAMGTGFNGVTRQKMADGTSWFGAQTTKNPFKPDPIDINLDDAISMEGAFFTKPLVDNMPKVTKMLDKTQGKIDAFSDKINNPEAMKPNAFGPTAGDAIGIFGNLYSGIAPLMGAKRNAADNTLNPNFYEGYGEDALAANEESKKYIQGQEDKALSDINLDANKALSAGRNSSRGINTKRALDAGVFVNANKAKADVYDNFSKQMMQILGLESQLENTQDQVVMTGAKEADIANRMDADNAATQIGVAQEGMGRAIQQTGKDLNQTQMNEMMMNIMNEMSKYGIGFNNRGNYTSKKGQ